MNNFWVELGSLYDGQLNLRNIAKVVFRGLHLASNVYIIKMKFRLQFSKFKKLAE